MAKVFLVDLEAVETRYTGEWKTHLPALLRRHGHDVQVISGLEDIPKATTPGAFLNFGGTNIYKASQVEKMGRLFCEGKVKAGDHFIFTDAWHPGVVNLKYMSELLEIPVKIHGLWHAGSYDEQDFLGRLIGPARWVRHAEKSFYHCFDHNYFASEFHVKMFFDELLHDGVPFDNPWYDEDWRDVYTDNDRKIVRSGWPMEYMEDTLLMYKNMPKRDLILFPHRLAPEKQVEIFMDLKERLPQYEFVICQERQLTKNEYHNLLGESKLVFSANLQETLGISWYEGALVNAIPMVPDRLSYSEMALDEFKYPSDWTVNFSAYNIHREKVVRQIMNYMENYEKYLPGLNKQVDLLKKDFFSCAKLLEMLK
jgi:glycosyltransferase involved in cell wall biosynthesis